MTMEKQKLEKLFEKTRTLALTDGERATVRQRVILFMREHPVPHAEFVRPFEWIRAVFYKPIPLKLKYVMPLLLILALLASGGGVSYAAQGSLPGDVLYPVKVDINEPIAGAFQFGTQAQAQWNAELAQSRLQEAEQLAAQNKLTPQIQAQVATRLQDAVAAAQNGVTQLQDKNQVAVAAQVNNDLETALRVHAAILTRLAVKHQDQGDVQNIAGAAAQQAQRVADAGDQIDASTTEQVRASGPDATNAVANKHDEVLGFVDAVASLFKDQGSSLDATTSAQIQASLNVAQQKITAGDAANQAGNYVEAFTDYQAAQQATQDAKVQIVATHTYRAEFENEDTASSSQNAPGQQQNEYRDQEQNINASSSDKNRQTEQNQHESQNRFIPKIEDDLRASVPVNQNASATTNLQLQPNASGTTINVGGEVNGGDGQQNGHDN
ncbi:MAG: DUF5667 domain-containing protein [Candidatus Paceibacterota bacterium]|jgi:hypothetical protein